MNVGGPGGGGYGGGRVPKIKRIQPVQNHLQKPKLAMDARNVKTNTTAHIQRSASNYLKSLSAQVIQTGNRVVTKAMPMARAAIRGAKAGAAATGPILGALGRSPVARNPLAIGAGAVLVGSAAAAGAAAMGADEWGKK